MFRLQLHSNWHTISTTSQVESVGTITAQKYCIGTSSQEESVGTITTQGYCIGTTPQSVYSMISIKVEIIMWISGQTKYSSIFV